MANWVDEYLRQMAIRRERVGWTMYGSDYQDSKQTVEERTRGFVEEVMRAKGATWVVTTLRDRIGMDREVVYGKDGDKFDGGPAWKAEQGATTVIQNNQVHTESSEQWETIQFARQAMADKGPLWVRVALHEAYARDSKQEQGLKDLQDLQAGVGIGGPVWKEEKTEVPPPLWSKEENDTIQAARKEMGPRWVAIVLKTALSKVGKTVEQIVEESARTTAHMQTQRVMGLWATTEGKVHIKLANGTEVVVPLEVGEQFELLQEAQVTVRTLP